MRYISSAARSGQTTSATAGRQEAFPFAHRAGQEPRPEMLCFRTQTFAIVCHFFEISCQVGRIVSLMGREFFHAKISHHGIPSFENQALFVHDVERCLKRLQRREYELLTMVGLYGLSKAEIAVKVGRTRAAVNTRFQHALDRLSEIFLATGILTERAPDRRQQQMRGRRLPPDIAPRAMRKLPPKKPSASVSAAAAHTSGHPDLAAVAQASGGHPGIQAAELEAPRYLIG